MLLQELENLKIKVFLFVFMFFFCCSACVTGTYPLTLLPTRPADVDLPAFVPPLLPSCPADCLATNAYPVADVHHLKNLPPPPSPS